MDSPRGRAFEAGEEMNLELDAIQARLRALKRELDARKSVAAVKAEAEAAAGAGESAGRRSRRTFQR